MNHLDIFPWEMSDRNQEILRTVATTAASAIVGGLAAYALTRLNARLQHDDMLHEIEKLRLEVERLRAEVMSVRTQPSSSVRKSPTKQRHRSVTFDSESYDSVSYASPATSSTELRSTTKVPRVSSYQSLTSDGEYADAEEEWDNGTITISCLDDPSRASVTIPILSYSDIDKCFGTPEVKNAYASLKKRYEGGEKSDAELLWRLAKCCNELAAQSTDKNRKKELLFEGQKHAVNGYKSNEKNFQAIKWAAIMTGQITDFLGTKEKIEEGINFKNYLDKALAMEPKEFSLLHMRGRYAFSVAGLSWLERKAAAVFFASPPTATYDEALADFLAAYDTRPEWIENLFYIGKTYFQKSDKANTKKYLQMAVKIDPVDEAENSYIAEAQKMIGKC